MTGSYPFPGMSSKKLIKELQRGYRMPRPDHCSGDVYVIAEFYLFQWNNCFVAEEFRQFTVQSLQRDSFEVTVDKLPILFRLSMVFFGILQPNNITHLANESKFSHLLTNSKSR